MIRRKFFSEQQTEPFPQHNLCSIAFLIKLQLQRYRHEKGRVDRDGGELHDILFGKSETGEDDLGAPSSPYSNKPTNEVSPSHFFFSFIFVTFLHSNGIQQIYTSMA